MASMESVGLSPEQAGAIRLALTTALADAGNEATRNLAEKHRAMTDLASQMGTQQAEIVGYIKTFNDEKEAMKTHMERFHTEAEEIKRKMEQHSEAFSQVGESITELKADKDAIVQDITAKVDVVEGLIRTLNDATTHAVQTLRHSYGGIEDTMNRHAEKVEGQFTNAARAVEDIKVRLSRVEGAGGRSGGGQPDRHGSDHDTGLISVKDVKLPLLPEANPSVATFRKWWKDLSKYCQRREAKWRAADTLFRVIRGYPNEIVSKEFAQFMQVCTNRDKGTTRGLAMDFGA